MRTPRPDGDAFQALRRANPFPNQAELHLASSGAPDSTTTQFRARRNSVLLVTAGSVAAAILAFVLTAQIANDPRPTMKPVGCQIHDTTTRSNDGIVCISSHA